MLAKDKSTFAWLSTIGTSLLKVSKVEVKSPGDNYKVGDTLTFSDADSTGFGAAGRVSRLNGKSVSSLNASITEISNVELIPSNKKGTYTIQSASPHGLQALDIVNISGISTTSSKIEGSYTIGVSSERFRIVGYLPNHHSLTVLLTTVLSVSSMWKWTKFQEMRVQNPEFKKSFWK